MSERLDVQEEMTRLATHIEEFRKTLSDGGAVGKRIGFLLQEMLRETNTTGSKCQDSIITALVISMKEELEAIQRHDFVLIRADHVARLKALAHGFVDLVNLRPALRDDDG